MAHSWFMAGAAATRMASSLSVFSFTESSHALVILPWNAEWKAFSKVTEKPRRTPKRAAMPRKKLRLKTLGTPLPAFTATTEATASAISGQGKTSLTHLWIQAAAEEKAGRSEEHT